LDFGGRGHESCRSEDAPDIRLISGQLTPLPGSEFDIMPFFEPTEMLNLLGDSCEVSDCPLHAPSPDRDTTNAVCAREKKRAFCPMDIHDYLQSICGATVAAEAEAWMREPATRAWADRLRKMIEDDDFSESALGQPAVLPNILLKLFVSTPKGWQERAVERGGSFLGMATTFLNAFQVHGKKLLSLEYRTIPGYAFQNTEGFLKLLQLPLQGVRTPLSHIHEKQSDAHVFPNPEDIKTGPADSKTGPADSKTGIDSKMEQDDSKMEQDDSKDGINTQQEGEEEWVFNLHEQMVVRLLLRYHIDRLAAHTALPDISLFHVNMSTFWPVDQSLLEQNEKDTLRSAVKRLLDREGLQPQSRDTADDLLPLEKDLIGGFNVESFNEQKAEKEKDQTENDKNSKPNSKAVAADDDEDPESTIIKQRQRTRDHYTASDLAVKLMYLQAIDSGMSTGFILEDGIKDSNEILIGLSKLISARKSLDNPATSDADRKERIATAKAEWSRLREDIMEYANTSRSVLNPKVIEIEDFEELNLALLTETRNYVADSNALQEMRYAINSGYSSRTIKRKINHEEEFLLQENAKVELKKLIQQFINMNFETSAKRAEEKQEGKKTNEHDDDWWFVEQRPSSREQFYEISDRSGGDGINRAVGHLGFRDRQTKAFSKYAQTGQSGGRSTRS
jgi:hypothetical protein